MSVVYVLLLLTFPVAVDANRAKIDEQCHDCRDLVGMFIDEFKATDRGLYEGGDTAWEVKNLREYRKSEVRLIEITDKIYAAKRGPVNRLLEQVEENLEDFWYAHWDHLNTPGGNEELDQYLCVSLLKYCCLYGYFGPDCEECKGGGSVDDAISTDGDRLIQHCSGHGECHGNGTRSGTGKCSCSMGHKGEQCEECAMGYRREAEGDHSSECIDINECTNPHKPKPCEDGQYCTNRPGHYACKKCHHACNGETCNGPDPEHCTGLTCAEGYEVILLDEEEEEEEGATTARGCQKIYDEDSDSEDGESSDDSSGDEDDDETIFFDLETMGATYKNKLLNLAEDASGAQNGVIDNNNGNDNGSNNVQEGVAIKEEITESVQVLDNKPEL